MKEKNRQGAGKRGMIVRIEDEEAMLDLGAWVADYIVGDGEAVIELIGDVGAGKTTFVRGLAEGLGVKKAVTSPSFTISKKYALPDGSTLTHYDFYRLSDPGVMAEDLTEAVRDGGVVVVEWADSIANLLPENRTKILFKVLKNGAREVEVVEKPVENFLEEEWFWGGTEAEDGVFQEDDFENGLVLYLDTSTEVAILKLNEKKYEFPAGKGMAEGLLAFMRDKLAENGKRFEDVTEIRFFTGPGSFTGLRIGAAVVNALSHELFVPLYDHHGVLREIIVPEYGGEANISQPRK